MDVRPPGKLPDYLGDFEWRIEVDIIIKGYNHFPSGLADSGIPSGAGTKILGKIDQLNARSVFRQEVPDPIVGAVVNENDLKPGILLGQRRTQRTHQRVPALVVENHDADQRVLLHRFRRGIHEDVSIRNCW